MRALLSLDGGEDGLEHGLLEPRAEPPASRSLSCVLPWASSPFQWRWPSAWLAASARHRTTAASASPRRRCPRRRPWRARVRQLLTCVKERDGEGTRARPLVQLHDGGDWGLRFAACPGRGRGLVATSPMWLLRGGSASSRWPCPPVGPDRRCRSPLPQLPCTPMVSAAYT
jgi:hypothetical protein